MAEDWKEEIIAKRLGGKREWTDEERQELAKKMDEELEDSIKEACKKSSGLPPEERWEPHNWKEKMAEHPLFAGIIYDKSENFQMPDNPLYEGLAQLKFSEEDNTPAELAETYRQDGVDMFTKGDYAGAITYFTEGLEQDIDDMELKAKLFNNRAAANYHIKKYDLCIEDSKEALKLKPDYAKPLTRVGQCYFDMKSYMECVKWCDKHVDVNPLSKSCLVNMRRASCKEQSKAEALERKKAKQWKENRMKQKQLSEAIEKRGINVGMTFDSNDLGTTYLDGLKPVYEPLKDCIVTLELEVLQWPVVFLYPEYCVNDVIHQFDETIRFCEQLTVMFDPSNLPPWDEEKKYKPKNLSLFYTDKSTNEKVEFSPDRTLLSVLKEKRYQIDNGTPEFFVVLKGSHPNDFR